MTSALLLIVVALVAGYACGRSRAFPEGAATVLNQFVIWVCLPAVILRLVPRIEWQPGLAVLIVTPWAVGAVLVLLVVGLAHALRLPRDVLGALLLCVPIGNTSFLGFPMIEALLGKEAIRYAVLYDQLGSFLAMATYALIVVARFSSDEAPTVRSVLRRLFRFPPFIALLVAFAVAWVPVQSFALLDSVLLRLGDALVPVALFAVGLKLELRPPKQWGAVVMGLGLKMGVAPLLAFGLARAFGAGQAIAEVAVLEAGMPPSITVGALSMMAGLAPSVAAGMVGYGIALSFASLPALLALLF